MYAGRIACSPLVSYDKYADGTDRQTDGRQTVTLRFPLDEASVINGRIKTQKLVVRNEGIYVGCTHLGASFSPRGDVFDVSTVRIVDVALHHTTATEAARLAHGTSLSTVSRHVPANYNHTQTRCIVYDSGR